jgi:hypothetical protein
MDAQLGVSRSAVRMPGASAGADERLFLDRMRRSSSRAMGTFSCREGESAQVCDTTAPPALTVD